jgi:hypothetical protein
LRDDAEIEPVDGRGRLTVDGGVKILQGLGEALLAKRDQAEKMQGFCMVWGELERLPVGRFGLCQAIGLLMDASLFEPGFDRRRGTLVRYSSFGFLTASLGSIHDASTAAGRERS